MTSTNLSQPCVPEAVPFHIPATPATSLQRPCTLKAADTFLVADQYGDLSAVTPCAEGLFHGDTRYLSGFVLKLNGARPLLLGSSVTPDSEVLQVNLTNPDFYRGTEVILARDSIHLLRTATLVPGCLTTQINIRNYTFKPAEVTLETEFGSDFADIFEVRGFKRNRRGQQLKEHISANAVLLAYKGLDEVVRCCRIEFSVSPEAISARHTRHRLVLQPEGTASLTITITCALRQEAPSDTDPFHVNPRQATMQRLGAHEVATSKELLNQWIMRSRADLNMLITQKPQGPYPYAGIPWFSTVFGRDGLIAALECLWLFPELARGVLGYLAATQATDTDPSRDAEPGKILHEERLGEMALLDEVPFGRYYGSVDATPLFVVLAGAYWDRTHDLAFLRSLWPNIQAALAWMRDHGGRDQDGFLEYARLGERGLVNQGWKDSV